MRDDLNSSERKTLKQTLDNGKMVIRVRAGENGEHRNIHVVIFEVIESRGFHTGYQPKVFWRVVWYRDEVPYLAQGMERWRIQIRDEGAKRWIDENRRIRVFDVEAFNRMANRIGIDSDKARKIVSMSNQNN